MTPFDASGFIAALGDAAAAIVEWLFAIVVDVQVALGDVAALWLVAPYKGQMLVLAVACLGIVATIAAQPTPSRNALVRYVWLAGTVAWVVAAWFAGALLLAAIPGAQGALLAAMLIAFGIWAIGKMVQGHRFAALADARRAHLARLALERVELARHREDFVRSLGQAIVAERGYAVIGLQGGWGAGKSHLVERLVAGFDLGEYGAAEQDAIAVVVNIWEYQSYGDLQWGVLQAIYAHPRSLRSHGWLDLPLWMLLSHWLRLRVRDVKLAIGGSEVNGHAELRLPWQYHLEKVVARHQRRRCNVVIVLDEIDRSEPAVVQIALTLLRRSLNLPGVVAVVPYVPEVVHEKAFSPLTLALPDLASTAHTLLMRFFHEDQAGGRAAPAPAGRNPHADAEAIFDRARADSRAHADSDSDRANGAVFRAVLSLAPLLQQPPHRSRYNLLMEEKYLGERWHVPNIAIEDLLHMLAHDGAIEQAFQVGYGQAACHERIEALKAWLEGQRRLRDGDEGDQPPSRLPRFHRLLSQARFRPLRGYWQEHLTRKGGDVAQSVAALKPEVPLALAVWRAARLRS